MTIVLISAARDRTYQEGVCSRRRLVFTVEQVLFECNEVDLHEAVARPLPNLDQLPSDSWDKPDRIGQGYFEGGLRNVYGLMPLARHIEQYTERRLSHQSDALNAMRGIFERFAKFNDPVPEYWGIPMAPTAFVLGDDISRLDSLHANVQAAFGFGLLWNVPLNQNPDRRSGFPSWSWAGWIAPVKWPTWSGQDVKDTLGISSFSVVGDTGSENTLSSDMLSQIKFESSRGHTPALRIDAEVLSIKFSWTPDSKFGQLKNGSVRTFAGPVFYVPDLAHNDNHYWPLMLTAQVQEGSKLWDALCNEHLQCVVLDDRFALVVWREERIGLLALETYLDEDLDDVRDMCASFVSYSYPDEKIPKNRNLRDTVRSERRAVIVR
jgi:hypothetical protein